VVEEEGANRCFSAGKKASAKARGVVRASLLSGRRPNTAMDDEQHQLAKASLPGTALSAEDCLASGANLKGRVVVVTGNAFLSVSLNRTGRADGDPGNPRGRKWIRQKLRTPRGVVRVRLVLRGTFAVSGIKSSKPGEADLLHGS
jgi:hypothetical protein